MAFGNLIDDNRAQLSSKLAALSLEVRNTLVSAASGAVRDYCQNNISLESYSEYKNGGIYIREPLLLRHDPVTQITRVAANPVPSLMVSNTDTINNQRATIATDDAGNGAINSVILYWVASAVPTTQPLSVVTYPTIGQMATAINAQGHGWSASVMPSGTIDLNKYPSSDLRPLQGATTCISGSPAYLSAWLETISPFGNTPWFDQGGDAFSGQTGWRLDAETGEMYGRFPRGQMNIRVDYTAGHATIPDQVQEAVVLMAIYLSQSENVNLLAQATRLGAASIEFRRFVDMPSQIKRLLDPYSRAASRALYR